MPDRHPSNLGHLGHPTDRLTKHKQENINIINGSSVTFCPNRRTILGILYYLGFPNAKVVYSSWSGNFQMLGAKPDETKSFLIRQNESKQNLKLVMPFSLNTDQSF